MLLEIKDCRQKTCSPKKRETWVKTAYIFIHNEKTWTPKKIKGKENKAGSDYKKTREEKRCRSKLLKLR